MWGFLAVTSNQDTRNWGRATGSYKSLFPFDYVLNLLLGLQGFSGLCQDLELRVWCSEKDEVSREYGEKIENTTST